MTADFQTCLDLSNAVYGGSNAGNIPVDWTQIPLPGTTDNYARNLLNGFVGAAYGLDANHDGVYEQIVIAYRGTERNGLGERAQDAEGNPIPDVPLSPDGLDTANDAQIVAGIVPSQYADAWDFYDYIKAQYGDNITITGHSSGGALAQLIAAKALEEYNVVNSTYTFNAPGVEALLSQIGCSTSLNYSFINNYSVMNDWCGMARQHIGNLYTMPPIEIQNSTNSETQKFNIMTDTHEGIFNYTQSYFFNKPVGFNQSEGLALWYYDTNNIYRLGASAGEFDAIIQLIGTQTSETALQNAVNIIENELVPQSLITNTLHYSTDNGDYIIDTNQSNTDLIGTSKNDTIWGNEGNDVIDGGSGTNKLYGEAGNDYIIAGDNNDYIDGGADNDILVAGIGNDMLIGGTGDDELYSGTGKSMLIGGIGNDTYHVNMLNGLSGNDFSGKTYNFMSITNTTIIDSDGVGSVIAGGITLSGGTQVKGTTDTFTDNSGFTYILSGSTLTVSNIIGSFQINDFTNGALGILTLLDQIGCSKTADCLNIIIGNFSRLSIEKGA